MSELRLAGNFINFTEILGSYGHLQIVFVDDDGTQLENEVQSAIPASIFGEWQYPNIQEHTTNTSNYTADIGDKSKYTYVKLDLGDRSAKSVWEILLETREEFMSKGKDIDYDREKNSNSYVTSLLSVVGIDVNDVIAGATPTGVNKFPGSGAGNHSSLAIGLKELGTVSPKLKFSIHYIYQNSSICSVIRRIRFLKLKISLLFISFLLSQNIIAQNNNFDGVSLMKDPRRNLLEVCEYQISDYQSLKKEIEERYAVGSSVTLLQNDFEHYFGAVKEKKLVKDYLFMKNKNEDANSWIYFYSKMCDYAPSYSVQWNIYILTDLTENITEINLRPILQTTELSLINVPFNFEFFENAEAMRKALWSLTGTGTEKNKILEIMLDASGEYGDLETIKIRNPEKRLGYRYQYIAETLIASRIAAYEFNYVVIWEFNDQDELIDLSVN